MAMGSKQGEALSWHRLGSCSCFLPDLTRLATVGVQGAPHRHHSVNASRRQALLQRMHAQGVAHPCIAPCF